MNQTKSLNKRRFVIAGTIAAIISIALLFWARDIIREVIVLPVSYLIYLVRLFLLTTPQIVCWLTVLVIAFTAAWRSLGRRKRVIAPDPPELAELAYATTNPGRVNHWAIKVDLLYTSEGSYYQANFHNALGKLLLDLLAHRYRLTPNQVEDRLRTGQIHVPDEVQAYLQFALRRMDVQPMSLFGWMWRSLRERVRGWLAPHGLLKSQPVDPRIAIVLKYMEDELEVSYDDSDR